MPHYHAPLDPSCPEVEHAFQIPVTDEATGEVYWIDDPMGAPVWDELWESFEVRHRAKCRRCQVYGAENIEVAC